MKATYAAFQYGGPDLPVAEANLPELDLKPVVDAALKQMAKLSGGFQLDPPDTVLLTIAGNGYAVQLNTWDGLKEGS